MFMVNRYQEFMLIVFSVFITLEAFACPDSSQYFSRYYLESAGRHYPPGKLYEYLYLAREGYLDPALVPEVKRRFSQEKNEQSLRSLHLLLLLKSGRSGAREFVLKNFRGLNTWRDPFEARDCAEKSLFLLLLNELYPDEIDSHYPFAGVSTGVNQCLLDKNSASRFLSALTVLSVAHPTYHPPALEVKESLTQKGGDLDNMFFFEPLLEIPLFPGKHDKFVRRIESLLQSDDGLIYEEELILALFRLVGGEHPRVKRFISEKRGALREPHGRGLLPIIFPKLRNHMFVIQELSRVLPASYCMAPQVLNNIQEKRYTGGALAEAVKFVIMSGFVPLQEQEALLNDASVSLSSEVRGRFRKLIAFRKSL